MLSNKKTNLTASIFLIAFNLAACGVDRKPHFKDKTFGQVAAPNVPDFPATEPPPALPPVTDPVVTPVPGPIVTPEEPTNPTEPEPEEPPVDEILGHYSFLGYFNLETVHRITKGDGYQDGRITTGGKMDEILADLLGFVMGPDPEERLTMQVKLTGESTSVVRQDGKTEGGDRIAELKGEETLTGVQYLDWVMPSDEKSVDCPAPFICIDRMVWKPETGKPMTYCYRDLQTKKPIVIPYSANPHFSDEAFRLAIGNGIYSRPFEVVKLEGVVACQAENTVVRDVKPVVYNINLGNLLDQNMPNFMRQATFNRLFANIVIELKFALYNPDTRKTYIPSKGAYIDQLTRLNSKFRFFVNSTENVIVKIEQTVQSQLRTDDPETVIRNIGRKYGEAAASLAQLMLKYDQDTAGIQVVHSFEFCTHLAVINNPFNHCTGRIQR